MSDQPSTAELHTPVELAFANNRNDAQRLADELGGRVERVADRRGWVVLDD